MTPLTQASSLHELLEAYPFLVDFLAEFNPRYAMLKNRAMRATAARFATLGMVAGMGGVEVEDLIQAIDGEVERRTGIRGGTKVYPSAGDGPAERTEALKAIIQDLHGGLPQEEARARFEAVVGRVTPKEIGAMEEQLIRGGTPVEEIQRLCDLHVAVVRGALEKADPVEVPPGHPVHTYRAANEIITRHANRLGELCAALEEGDAPDEAWRAAFRETVQALDGLHNHYLRKENELFPVLERHGITGPSKVMWGVHDDIREQLEAVRSHAEGPSNNVVEAGARLARSLVEMVYKENRILFPLAMETLEEKEWEEVRKGEDQLGYGFILPSGPYPAPSSTGIPSRTGEGFRLPVVSAAPVTPLPDGPAGCLDLGTGRLSLEQVDMILRHLPVDLSFVDRDGYVRYYSATPDRLFPRTPGAIGRHVTNCHPPKSVHMVEEILHAFASGDREVAEFWIEMGGRFIHIRYFAVRNLSREYLGCLEVSQDLTRIRDLEGQRRLLEWS
jgi:DUF438 domain-containing protein